MDNIFSEKMQDFVIWYIDDILIVSKSLDEHFRQLKVFKELAITHGLVLSVKKMILFQTDIEFLGHRISNDMIQLQPHVLSFVHSFLDKITDKTQLQRFLGCYNYISPFYKNFA